MEVLDDPDRTFAASAFVRLEVEPKALFHRRQAESAFYEAFFAEIDQWAVPGPELLERALTEATRNGLSALDALHVTAPIHRVSALTVKTLHPF
jgi:hypothetical protein